MSNREIADLLALSEVTVKHHIKSLRGKLGARNRLHAVCRANELQIQYSLLRRLLTGAARSAVLAVLHQVGDNAGIGQRRGVAKLGIIVGRDLAKNPAHDLARPSLGKLRRPLQ